MLPRLENVHVPENIEEATNLLLEPNVRPLYGGVALHRESPTDITAVVDLSRLGLEQHRVFDRGFSIGGMMSLEAARRACRSMQDRIPNARFLIRALEEEAPLNLRNTMTIGDVLVERRPNSVLMTALVLLDAQIDANGWPRFIHDWLEAPDVEVKRALITEVAIEIGDDSAQHAFEKVSRTPKDAPIVGAMAYTARNDAGELTDARLAMCGVADYPIPLADVDEELLSNGGDIDAALQKLSVSPTGDHWGSTEYRTTMAEVLARRVLERTL